MVGDRARLPDGLRFPFWDDETHYRRTYHVKQHHANADDENDGTADAPLVTIGEAASRVQAGERVEVHEGIYRECIRPHHGGSGPEAMIAYEAAPGEEVIVRGSRVFEGTLEPCTLWNVGDIPDTEQVWTASLPRDWFVGYNPFAMYNLPSNDRYYLEPAAGGRLTVSEHKRLLTRRGMVFVDGEPLEQVYYPHELGEKSGTFWVEDPGLTLHLRLPADVIDPADTRLEITTEEQLVAPASRGLGYIRLSGFRFEHAADGVPIPQRAMVSAHLGHHWIIEDNHIRWANACGIDVGDESWHRRNTDTTREDSGHHIIRGNHIERCGVCGIAAMHNNRHTLVENNRIEHIGDRNIERIWEAGGLKFHQTDGVLIRSNIIRHIRHAPGLWLDFLNRNTRVTNNVIADVESIQGGVYIEVSHEPVFVDHNLIWNVRGDDPGGDRAGSEVGHGVNVDSGEATTVAHNAIGEISDGFGVSANLNQAGRVVDGRVGQCRDHTVANNIFVDCPRRIAFARSADNFADGNLFSVIDDDTSFEVTYPEPTRVLNFDGWQRFMDFDEHGSHLQVTADVDVDACTLAMQIEGEVPSVVSLPELECDHGTPGPVSLDDPAGEYELPRR